MSAASEALARARAREQAREAAHVPTDYRALNKMIRRQRGALTRASNIADAERRRAKVIEVCAAAVREWNAPGAMWPDDWSHWQRTLDDQFPVFNAPLLGDLA